MYLSTTILGTTAVKHLELSTKAWILEVGSDRLTRAELAKVGCYNFVAAKNLSAVLKSLEVKSLSDLYARVAPAMVALPHLGVISLAVLGAAFEAKGIGGEMPLEAWARKHSGVNGHAQKLVTFDTLKARELAEHAIERKQRKQRKDARRGQAHKLRVERFTRRQHGAA